MDDLTKGITELARVCGDQFWWHVAKGKLTPKEPMYGVGIFREGETEMKAFGQGDTLVEAVEYLKRDMTEQGVACSS